MTPSGCIRTRDRDFIGLDGHASYLFGYHNLGKWSSTIRDIATCSMPIHTESINTLGQMARCVPLWNVPLEGKAGVFSKLSLLTIIYSTRLSSNFSRQRERATEAKLLQHRAFGRYRVDGYTWVRAGSSVAFPGQLVRILSPSLSV